MNSVAVKILNNSEDYRLSSLHEHLTGEDDELTRMAPLLECVPDWSGFFKLIPSDEVNLLHLHVRTGRPLGKGVFIDSPEMKLDRELRPQNSSPN